MFENSKILYHQGKQFIPNIATAKVPGIFRGRPVISTLKIDELRLQAVCPTNAIAINPISIDLGKCTFCAECAMLFPEKIKFTTDYKLSSNCRESLIIKEGIDMPIKMNENLIRKEIRTMFKDSLKLRQVSAAGDNSCEWELNAANNVQFDLGRFGVEFVASPRHADGIVITGSISENMAEALQICYEATPSPKLIILAGTDAISGGMFNDSPAINRQFIKNNFIDLYICGNPTHPLTVINGILDLIGQKRRG
jgi:Ni,Fe-hydrogenase III small subunit